MAGYDIAIAGAGPAGSVLALLAARRGCRVLLVEKSRFDKQRFGETAPPELRSVLTGIGLEHLAKAPFCRDAPGMLSIWGSDEARSRRHIFSPFGAALHLDRRAFDEALAFAAHAAGADFKLGCALRFEPDPRGGYVVRLSTGERFHSKLAIIATGRAGGSLGLPYARHYLDNNIGVAARFSSPKQYRDSRTVIEAVSGGWFYLAALPGNELIVVFITLASLRTCERQARLRWWLEALARTEVVRDALNGCPLPETLSVRNARGSYARTGAGENWLAIGDARIAPDPLSGQGILWAIDDGASAIELMSSVGRREFAEEMRAQTAREVDAYILESSRVYSSERRFKDDPFWRAVSGYSGS